MNRLSQAARWHSVYSQGTFRNAADGKSFAKNVHLSCENFVKNEISYTFASNFTILIYKMKIYHLLLGAALCSTVTSCFKDEPLNAECDIEQAYVHIDNPTDMFFAASDTLVNVLSDADNVTFQIKEGADVSAMAPVFKITDGATISPESGSVHDFSDGKTVVYTVTSQDGAWRRAYNVSFRAVYPVNEYNFETYRLSSNNRYYEWSDLSSTGDWIGNWATGNPGFAISMGTAKPDEFPSSPVSDGHSGSAVKLETMETGPLGGLVHMGIAAGNLYIGEFDVSQALMGTAGAMKATSFGRPFDQEPLQFTGWYKYKSAGQCVDGDCNPIPGTHDKGDIYAVLYRNHDASGNAFTLHGDDVKTSPQIVAMAQVPEITDTDDWTEFTVDFEYSGQIDRNLLANRGYSLAVVFTSSIEGASFRGAVGSTLHIDEVKIICAEKTE